MVGSTASSHVSGPPAADPVFTEKSVRIADGVLGYRSCGWGSDTIVLLHGISSGSGSWSECASVLAQRARVIAWDAPGYGASTPLASSAPAAPEYAQRIQALLEALQVKRCLLVGHSLGALMAAAYGSMPSHRAAGMLLISPALGYGGADNPQAAQVRAKRVAALAEQGIPGIAANLPDRLLSSAASNTARETVQRNALRLNAQGYLQAVELLCGDDINRYALPADATWVSCGEHDIVTTPEQSRGFAQRHGLEFTLIPGVGHACYVEQPRAVAKHILEVLNKISASDDHE